MNTTCESRPSLMLRRDRTNGWVSTSSLVLRKRCRTAIGFTTLWCGDPSNGCRGKLMTHAAQRALYQGGTITYAELLKNARQMALHRRQRNTQQSSQLAIRLPCANQLHHLQFPRGQRELAYQAPAPTDQRAAQRCLEAQLNIAMEVVEHRQLASHLGARPQQAH